MRKHLGKLLQFLNQSTCILGGFLTEPHFGVTTGGFGRYILPTETWKQWQIHRRSASIIDVSPFGIYMGDSVTSTHALEKHMDREVDNVYRARRHAPFASFILSSWVSWLIILEGVGHQNHRKSSFAIHYTPENERMSPDPEKEPLYKGDYIFQSRQYSGRHSLVFRGVYKSLPSS